MWPYGHVDYTRELCLEIKPKAKSPGTILRHFYIFRLLNFPPPHVLLHNLCDPSKSDHLHTIASTVEHTRFSLARTEGNRFVDARLVPPQSASEPPKLQRSHFV